MRYSTPLTATFVSLIVHTLVLWTALFFSGGIPTVNFVAVGAIFLTGIVQPFMSTSTPRDAATPHSAE